MITAFILLQNHLALLALPEQEFSLQIKNPILIAFPRMCRHEALLAEDDFTDRAEHYFLLDIDETFTVFSRTQLQLRVFSQIGKNQCLVVSLLFTDA